jgi:hypothetical protein
MGNNVLTGPDYVGNFAFQAEDLKGQKWCKDRFIDTTVIPLTSADTYDILTIDAGILVTDVIVVVQTVEGAAETIDLGDDAAATAFFDDLSLRSSTPVKYYTAANTVRMLANAAITAAKFWVIVEGIRLA